MKESLLAEWDYEKNGSVDPQTIKDHSNKKFYWKCPKGHPSYLMPVTKRTFGHGCPVCSNHKIIKGINDFATTEPELMKEWAWEKNTSEGIDPTTFSSGSSRAAWWKCKKCGNEWKALVSNRTRIHSGCPYCANLKVKKGFNDLASLYPEIAKEWDCDQNGEMAPDTIVAHSTKKVWWICNSCGYKWQATPLARVLSHTGCPECSLAKRSLAQRITKASTNPFFEKYSKIAEEWDYEKNKTSPSQYAAGSEKQVWWKCEKGHSWKAAINSRVRGRGCPYCSNQKVLLGYNDLFSTNPELHEEWDYEKNTVIPAEITAGSNKRAWWVCKSCGKSWSAIISSRAKGYGCPDCGRKEAMYGRLKAMTAKNPFVEQFPEIAEEWDYEKNSNLDLSMIPASSNRIVWWKCKEGHSFRQSVNSRTLNKTGCPYCHGQKVLPGINDLQTLNPGLAAEWDYEKNSPLKPSDVFSHSSKFVWWKCPYCENSWKAKINNRANGRGCPTCNPYGTSFVEQVFYFYVKQLFPDAENRFSIHGVEIDIYIPSIKTGIEYDGAYFHSSEKAVVREDKKDMYCIENGIQLVRLREIPLQSTKNAKCFSCDCSTWGGIEAACRSVLCYLKPEGNPDISIQRDYPQIITYKKRLKKDEYYQYNLFDMFA